MNKKKILIWAVIIAVIIFIGAIAIGSSGDSPTENQGSGTASTQSSDSNLANYKVEIMSCRLAKDYSGKDVVIVKYKFTNNNEKPTSFMVAFDDNVYQNGVGLNNAYILDDDANYSSDNQTKEIKKGATLEVEAAYELNDTTTDIEVEVSQLFSMSDKVIKKTFSIK